MRVRVTALALRHDKVLMVECYDPGCGHHLNFPGGGLDLGECLAEAASRELREECCLELAPGRLLAVSEHWERGDLMSLFVTFLFEVPEGVEPEMPARPDLYQTGLGWYTWEELANAQVLPPISAQLKQALEGGAAYLGRHS